MIQKLRWKFIAIMMSITGILLSVILIALYYTAKMNYQQQSLDMLHAAIQEDHQKNPPPQKYPSAPQPENRPFGLLIADQKGDGRIVIEINLIYGIEEEDVDALLTAAKAGETNSGVIKDKNLRYLYKNRGFNGTIRYAFMDIYAEQNALHWNRINSFAIGLFSFAIFFFFSILLSRWAVQPVEDAWKQQRQFVADASHELKTPLTVILSNINMLAQSPGLAAGHDKQRVEHIQSEAVRMKELIQSLLDLARSDSAEASSFSHKILDFSYLVNSTAAIFEPLAFEMNKSISSETEASISIIGDEKKLQQLVSILLDNACKYSTENSCITLQVFRKSKEVILKVANEGVPFTTEEKKRIFQRFYRTDASRSRIPGYGLGLSIAQSIVSEHKGKIEAETDGVSRNWFTVRLPLSGS